MYTCYVAMGDSLTEGIGDDIIGYEKLPFPEQLAHHLNIQTLHNLGTSGLRSDQVLQTQLQQTLDLKPDLVSITAGGNDILQKRFNKRRFKRHMRTILHALRQEECVILTCTIPDLFDVLTIPLPHYQRFIGRLWLRQFNDAMNELAKEFNTLHLDFYHHDLAVDQSIWSSDAIHPNAKGYFEIANAYADLLKTNALTPQKGAVLKKP